MRRALIPVLATVVLFLAGCGKAGTESRERGKALVSVKALPGNRGLEPGTVNLVVTTGSDLGFAVTVENTSGSRQRHLGVTLKIRQASSTTALTRQKTVDRINGGERKTLVFGDFAEVQFATRTTVQVEIQPVEQNADRNRVAYPVIFSTEMFPPSALPPYRPGDYPVIS